MCSLVAAAVRSHWCGTVDLPRLAKRSALWLVVPCGLSWLCFGLQCIYAVVLADTCYEIDRALAASAIVFSPATSHDGTTAIGEGHVLRAAAFDSLIRCGTEGAFADADTLLYRLRQINIEIVFAKVLK